MGGARKRHIARLAAALLGAVVLLAGCGQKGPLYLPDEEPKKKQKETTLERATRPA